MDFFSLQRITVTEFGDCEGYFLGGGRFWCLFFLTLEQSCELILQFTPFPSCYIPKIQPQTAIPPSFYEFNLRFPVFFI